MCAGARTAPATPETVLLTVVHSHSPLNHSACGRGTKASKTSARTIFQKGATSPAILDDFVLFYHLAQQQTPSPLLSSFTPLDPPLPHPPRCFLFVKMAGISPQIVNLAIILGMTQVAKRIPFDDPQTLNLVRALYLASNVVIAGLYFYVQLAINKKKDLTTLKYVEPAPMGSTEEGKLVTTTIHAYDSQQIRTAFRGQFMGVAMMAFMHLYLKYTNPLLIQSIIPLKSAFENNMVKIHLWGQPASGDLKRPFKQPQGFMSAMQGGPAQSDKKAVEAAERAGRGGAKEE